MAFNVKTHWHQVRTIAAKFDPEAAGRDAQELSPHDRTSLKQSQKEVWLVSIESEQLGSHGGRVISAHPWTAAEWIVQGTHVLATPEQIEEWKAELERRKVAIRAAEAERVGGKLPSGVVDLAMLSRAISNSVAAGKRKAVR